MSKKLQVWAPVSRSYQSLPSDFSIGNWRETDLTRDEISRRLEAAKAIPIHVPDGWHDGEVASGHLQIKRHCMNGSNAVLEATWQDDPAGWKWEIRYFGLDEGAKSGFAPAK